MRYKSLHPGFLYSYRPSYSVCKVFPLPHCDFFFFDSSLFLIMSSVPLFGASFSLNPTPSFQVLPYFLLLPSVSSCCRLLTSPFFVIFLSCPFFRTLSYISHPSQMAYIWIWSSSSQYVAGNRSVPVLINWEAVGTKEE